MKHPVWTNFKHIDLNVDTALIFPHGAGGHFVANQLTKTHKGNLNEYHLSFNKLVYPWFRMDTWGTEFINNTARLDDMVEVIEHMMLPNMAAHYPAMLGHYLPHCTAKIFNLTIKKLITIDVDRTWAWLPLMLANAKNLFVTSYSTKHFLIGHILSNFHHEASKRTSRFLTNPMYSIMTADSMIVANEKTAKLRHGLIEDSSPYMWDYTVWARSNGYTISENTFVTFSDEIFGETAVTEYYDGYYKDRTFNPDWSVAITDYIETFFLGQSCLHINVDDIVEYSSLNLEIIKKIQRITDGALNQQLTHSIPILENYLETLNDKRN